MKEDKMREILSGEARIPANVNQRIQDVYNSLNEIPQEYKKGIWNINWKKLYAAAAFVLVFSIFTAFNWDSVYAFAKGIVVGREGILVEKLPDVHYIKGKLPDDDCEKNDIHTDIKKYDSMNEAEKDFGVKLLKNKMGKQKAPASNTITALYTYWDGTDY